MAKFSISLQHKYDVNTYSGVKKTYDWLSKIIATIWPTSRVRLDISFDIGALSCNVDSIEEFTENAYGAPDYSFTTMGVFVYVRDELVTSFILIRNEMLVNASNKQILEQVVSCISKNDEDEDAQQQVLQQIIVQQNNGVIASEVKETLNLYSEKKESTLRKWGTAVVQNLLANWVWYLLTAAVTAFVTWISTK